MQRTNLYWQGHRVGALLESVSTNLHVGEFVSITAAIDQLSLPDTLTIRDIATMRIMFDRDFAELRGLTGVELEPSESEKEEIKKDIARWLGQRE